MEISGRTALVTGGASGLGRATTSALVNAGARVVVLDLPSAEASADLESFGAAVDFVPGDVTSASDAQRAVERASETGAFTILVNCAGIATPGRVLGKDGVPHSLEAFRRVVEVNLIGTFNVVRCAVPALTRGAPAEDEDHAVIINTASIAAFEGQIGQAAYAASKGGIVAMTLPLARELARHRIRVVTIAPGLFRTPLLASLPEEAMRALGAQVPHPARLGDPAEFALLATQILNNPMLNGEVIRLDGAVRMGPR